MYCTVTQLRGALAPSGGSGPWHTAADLTDPQLQEAIDEAASTVDVAIGARYAVPVAPVDPTANPLTYPHPVDFWCLNIAAYLATCTFRGSADFTDNDPVYRRYVTAVNAMTAVAKGIGSLPIASSLGTTTGSSGALPAENRYSGNLFEAGDFDLGDPRSNYLNDPRWRAYYGLEPGW